MNNLRMNKALWLITTALTLLAAVIGVVRPGIYNHLVPDSFLPGVVAQDWLNILICLVIFGVIVLTKAKDTQKQIILVGIMGAFLYLYAIFAIERVYNLAYYLYLAIFSLSFWSIVNSLISLDKKELQKIVVSGKVRKISSVFSVLIAVLFTLLWVSSLYPLLVAGNRIDFLYSIYVIDLCFIMPAFVITAVMSWRNHPYAIFFTPAMYILGIFVIFPLGLGEAAKPFFGMAVNVPSMIMSFVLAGAFVVMAFVNLISQNVSRS